MGVNGALKIGEVRTVLGNLCWTSRTTMCFPGAKYLAPRLQYPNCCFGRFERNGGLSENGHGPYCCWILVGLREGVAMATRLWQQYRVPKLSTKFQNFVRHGCVRLQVVSYRRGRVA